MSHCIKEVVVGQLQNELKQLKASERLPFRHLLDERRILAALARGGVVFRKRVFDPLTTVYAFLSQVIASEGSSCVDAVSRVMAERVAQGQACCSADSSSYCQARGRLRASVLAELARETGQELDRAAKAQWLWKGRRVVIVDGSTAEMADTPQNQAEYPQSSTQKTGLGFPMLRLVALFSLSVGTVLDCAIGPCRGKKSGEQSLFRQIQAALGPGTILLGDRLFDTYHDIAGLALRGADVVLGKNSARRADFRLGRKLGADDHLVCWQKPNYNAERFASRDEWQALPERIVMRETRKVVRRPGFRTRTIIIVTTLTDAERWPADELLDLFALRWHCELDLRCLKQALGMRRLRCKTPEMARKELWAYLLAYNLVRVRMAQAAALHDRLPRSLSFTSAKNHIHNFAAHLATAGKSQYQHLEAELLHAIATCRLACRTGRKEPRAVKKRRQKYSYLTKPRIVARQRLAA